MIDFDEIWQKSYSKYSRIEFVSFSFLFIKIDPYNFELYRFKVYAFFETQCTCLKFTIHYRLLLLLFFLIHCLKIVFSYSAIQPQLCVYIKTQSVSTWSQLLPISKITAQRRGGGVSVYLKKIMWLICLLDPGQIHLYPPKSNSWLRP